MQLLVSPYAGPRRGRERRGESRRACVPRRGGEEGLGREVRGVGKVLNCMGSTRELCHAEGDNCVRRWRSGVT